MTKLFLSGESCWTMKAAFQTRDWTHTTIATEFVAVEPGVVRRANRPSERVTAAIWYADQDDKEMERRTLQLFVDVGLPCWPDPRTLLWMLNRCTALRDCIHAGLVDHRVAFLHGRSHREDIPFPAVLKLGNVHRGQGKYLIRSVEDYPDGWYDEDESSLEPYFEGASVRVFVVGDQRFCAEVRNDRTWIKNDVGAEVVDYDGSPELVAHASAMAQHFGLELAGVDYIVEPSGAFHFLEVNQFPGFYGIDAVGDAAVRLFIEKMAKLDSRCAQP